MEVSPVSTFMAMAVNTCPRWIFDSVILNLQHAAFRVPVALRERAGRPPPRPQELGPFAGSRDQNPAAGVRQRFVSGEVGADVVSHHDVVPGGLARPLREDG